MAIIDMIYISSPGIWGKKPRKTQPTRMAEARNKHIQNTAPHGKKEEAGQAALLGTPNFFPGEQQP
jgi:hypothetical protein